MKLRDLPSRTTEAVVDAVAVPYRNRAKVLDLAGFVCLIVGLSMLAAPWAPWIGAFMWLSVRAVGIEREQRKP